MKNMDKNTINFGYYLQKNMFFYNNFIYFYK